MLITKQESKYENIKTVHLIAKCVAIAAKRKVFAIILEARLLSLLLIRIRQWCDYLDALVHDCMTLAASRRCSHEWMMLDVSLGRDMCCMWMASSMRSTPPQRRAASKHLPCSIGKVFDRESFRSQATF